MQKDWMRYVWILAILFVLAVVAVLLSMSIPNANTSQLAPQNASVQIADSYQAFDNNDLDGAIAVTNNILSINPNDIQALLAKASALAQKGSLEFKEQEYGLQAIAVARQVLALDPKNSEAWRIIGYANEIIQNYPAAHDAYAQSLAINPKNALTISQEAHAYDLQGELAKAETGYRAALAIDPALDQAQMGLARVLLAQQNTDAALSIFRQVFSETSNVRLKAEAAYSAGNILGASNDKASALQFMEQATTIDPSYPLGWLGLGTQLFAEISDTSSGLTPNQRNDLWTKSLDALEKAINLDPNQALASYQLGVELAAAGQKGDALKIFAAAKQAVPRDITLTASEKQQVLSMTSSAISVINK